MRPYLYGTARLGNLLCLSGSVFSKLFSSLKTSLLLDDCPQERYKQIISLSVFLKYALGMAGVAQSVRAPVCGTGGRGFNSHHSPHYF